MPDTHLTSHHRVKRKSARRSERGAAMVEAAFMMPMFIILFFTSLYAHNLNAKQIALNSETRAGAWGMAMSNCGQGDDGNGHEALPPGGGDGVSQQQLHGVSSNDASGAASQALSSGNGAGAIGSIASPVTQFIANLLPDPQGAVGQLDQNVNWRQPNVYTGGDPSNQTSVHQTVTLLCNQKPQNGSPGAAISGLACAILGKGC